MELKLINVTSLQLLKNICNIDGFAEFFINYGYARSAKRIRYYPDTNTFDVNNEIDDTWQNGLTEQQLSTETSIIEAIEKDAFVFTGIFQLNGIPKKKKTKNKF